MVTLEKSCFNALVGVGTMVPWDEMTEPERNRDSVEACFAVKFRVPICQIRAVSFCSIIS